MKKYIIAGVLVVGVIAYIIFANRNIPAGVPTGPSGTPSANGPTSTPTTTPPSGNPPTGNTSTPTGSTGQYKNGTYTGISADIIFPQTPSGEHSSVISAFALPALAQTNA
jgi:hypothetical protein